MCAFGIDISIGIGNSIGLGIGIRNGIGISIGISISISISIGIGILIVIGIVFSHSKANWNRWTGKPMCWEAAPPKMPHSGKWCGLCAISGFIFIF